MPREKIKKEVKKARKDYTLTIAVIFFIAVIVLGFYILGDKEEVNPLEDKVVIDTSTNCDKVWEGAVMFARINNISESAAGAIVAAQCRIACEDKGFIYDDYKCTSDNQFLCYCNKEEKK